MWYTFVQNSMNELSQVTNKTYDGEVKKSLRDGEG